MTSGRCDDPNCTCRSSDLRMFTDQVLRRDAAKTDYIVIPLIGGVLARSILARDVANYTETQDDINLRREAERVTALAERGRSESWESDAHAHGVVANLVFCNWPAAMALGSISYMATLLDLPINAPADTMFAAAVRFLSATPPPSLTESVIVALLAAMRVSTNRQELPLLAKCGRRLRVVLADRLRREGLTTWPKVLIAAVDDWTIPTLEQLVRTNAAGGDAGIRFIMEAADSAAAAAADDDETQPPPVDVSPPETDEDSDDVRAAEKLVEDTVAEITYLRTQADRAQRERDTFAGRDARSRSRVESLERQLASERVTRQRLERELAALREERDRFDERLAADEALLEGAPALPADTFAGRRVLFFTGVEAADARAALAHGFQELGADQVDVYWTDKTRGPDAFPADALIAVDVSHMSHSAWSAIVEKASRAGAWCYWGKHGATLMARATAAAWRRHLEA